MERTLVVPEELEKKLNEAYTDSTVHSKWLEIGIDSDQDMIYEMLSRLNEKYPKLKVTNYRIDSKDNIKESIENIGSNSVYSGYFEKETGSIDSLFFYIHPKLNSGNDFLTRQVMPTLLGIYESISQRTTDLYFNNRPVFIVNLNETNRSEQRAVKISFICAELLGFNYLDMFDRGFRDVLGIEDSSITSNQINNLTDYDYLLSPDGNNEYFEINKDEKILKLISERITNSSNASAEMYRYLLRVLPAVYMAIDKEYSVDMTEFNNVTLSMMDTVRSYISKINVEG